jgi:hypothetical protein
MPDKPNLSAAALQAARLQQATLTDRVTTAFERELMDVYRNLERQLRALVNEATDLTRTQVIRVSRVATLRKQIRQALEDAGFDALLLSATDAGLDRLAEAALQSSLGQDVAAMLTTLEPRIAALKATVLTDLLEQPEAVAHQIWKGVTQGVFSARKPAEILADLGEQIDDTVPHIRTLYDTAVSVYSRQVESLTSDAENPDALYLYTGPVDGLMRPFCREQAGKVYRRADIDDLDNGQLPNTFLTAGGYNCRHGWTALGRFSELRDLAGTGERVPEVDEALKFVTVVAKAA